MTTTLSIDQPFAGLRPFDFSDRYYFFGRTEQTYALLRLLDLSRFVAVVGSSGSGKSSLVRAGLFALLDKERTQPGGRDWKRAIFTPGRKPIDSLTNALVKLGREADPEWDSSIEEIRRDGVEIALKGSRFGVSRALHDMPELGDASILLVVDQFEELFRFGQGAVRLDQRGDAVWRDQRKKFVQLLLEAAADKERSVHVLITMRSDFIGDCARFDGLPEAVCAAQFLVPKLNRTQREAVICEPLKMTFAQIDPGLVEQLLNDGVDQDDQLPVLQHCLLRLWNIAKNKALPGEPLTLSKQDYDSTAIGGLAGALSRHADEVLESLPRDERAVEQVFRALSELDKDGRAVRRSLEFAQLLLETGLPEAQLKRILDKFRSDQCLFIIPSQSAVPELQSETLIDVAHEALLRRWRKLSDAPEQNAGIAIQKGWLADERADAQEYGFLLESTKERSASGEPIPLALLTVESRERRWNSWPRTEAWAARYGGRYNEVQDLFRVSRIALDEEKQKKANEEKRKKDEEAQKIAELEQRAKDGQKLAEFERQRADALRSTADAERAKAEAERVTARVQRERTNLARKNRTIFAVAATVFFAAAVVLALLYVKEREALDSQGLALIAINMDKSTPKRSAEALLAADAYELKADNNLARQALLISTRRLHTQRKNVPNWIGAVTAHDGQLVALLEGGPGDDRNYRSSKSGRLSVFEATGLRPVATIQQFRANLMCGFSRTSRIAAVSDGVLSVVDLSKPGQAVPGYPIRLFANVQDRDVTALACLPKEQSVIVATRGGKMVIVDEDGRVSDVGTQGIGPVFAVVVGASGEYAAAISSSGDKGDRRQITLFDLESHKKVWMKPLVRTGIDCSTMNCQSLATFDSAGKKLAWYDDGNIYTRDVLANGNPRASSCPVSNCERSFLFYYGSEPAVLSLRGAGTALLHYDQKDAKYESDGEDIEFPVADPLTEKPNHLLYDAEQGMLLTSDGIEFRFNSPVIAGLQDGPGWSESYALTDTGLAFIDKDGRLLERGLANWSPVPRLNDSKNPFRLRDTGDGKYAASYNCSKGEVGVVELGPAPRYSWIHDPKIAAGAPPSCDLTNFAYDAATGIATTLSENGLSRYDASKQGTDAERLSWNDLPNQSGTAHPVQVAKDVILSKRGNYVIVQHDVNGNHGSIISDVIAAGDRWKLITSGFVYSGMSGDEKYIFGRKVDADLSAAVYSLPDLKPVLPLPLPFRGGYAESSPGSSPDDFKMVYVKPGDPETRTDSEIHIYEQQRDSSPMDAILAEFPQEVKAEHLAFSRDNDYVIAQFSQTGPSSVVVRNLAIYSIDPGAWHRSVCSIPDPHLSLADFTTYSGLPSSSYIDPCDHG